MEERIMCRKCGRTQPAKKYWKDKQGVRVDYCKECLTALIVNDQPQTFKWILELFDVPYVETEWVNQCNKAYANSPTTYGSGSVIGIYLRMMKLNQYSKYGYADSDKLNFETKRKQEIEDENQKAMTENDQELMIKLQKQLDSGEITQAQFDTLMPMKKRKSTFSLEDDYLPNNPENIENIDPKLKKELVAAKENEEIMSNLTEDDVRYLTIKWGGGFTPSQWLRLEDTFNRYANEYELNVDREESLKQICKLSMKMDEALELGDSNAYKSLQGAYDSLRKSAKFTEQQNKEGNTRYLDSIGELVLFCEKEGGIIEQIPYPDDYPQDDVDYAIKDMKAYTYNLVTTELGLGDLIESYIKKLETQIDQEEIDFEAGLITSAEEEAAQLEKDTYNEDKAAYEFSNFLDMELEDQIAKIAAGEL